MRPPMPLTLALPAALLPALAVALPAAAQSRAADPATLAEAVPPTLVNDRKDEFFTFNIENDMFGGDSDRHYTNGVRLTYLNVLSQPPEWTAALTRALPFLTVTDKTAVAYSLGQNLYSPDDITQANPAPGQRPYAGFLYGSAAFSTLVEDHVDEFELTLGIVGPSALGRQTQKLVHEAVDSPKPMGWRNYQLHDEPALILAWQRRYPEAWAWNQGGWFAALEPRYGFALGNVYTYGSGGVVARFGPASSRWADMPPLVRPSMAGSGFFSHPEHDFSWYVFAGVEGRAVARNIFLDGNTFRDSPSVDKNLLVADLTAGLATSYGPVRLTYTLNHRTREYKGQENADVFGAISLGYRF